MVWHSFILNPRNYLADCLRFSKMNLWAGGLPWRPVAASINNEDFFYNPGQNAQKAFTTYTKHTWNNLDEPKLVLSCPYCRTRNTVDWTTSTTKSAWNRSNKGENGIGFVDPGFQMMCTSCRQVTDHELLRAQSFIRDVQKLLVHQTPMPGTILALDGKVQSLYLTETVRFGRVMLDTAFVNSLIQDKLAPTFGDTTTVQHRSMADIQQPIEATLQDRLAMWGLIGKQTLSKEARIGVRRMMACYWSNCSIFSMDLVGAVIRQGVFVEKMHKIDWLHSPSLRATMERFHVKYERFFEIMERNPGETVVPTLDVDLLWHTHQLAPQSYYAYASQKTQTFVDHDDKIEENKLSTSFEWTTKKYQTYFDDLYSECTCWYCESIREAASSGLARLVRGGKVPAPIQAQLDRLHAHASAPAASAAPDTHSANHISTHNAVRSAALADDKAMARVARHQLEKGYSRACQRARKEGRPPPARSRAEDGKGVAYDPYGYPVYLPLALYYPYMGTPFVTPGVYPANPACAAGGCCQGTCSAGVAAGGCAAGGCGGAGGIGGCGAIASCSGVGSGCGSGGGLSCGGGGGCGGGGC